MVCRFKCVVVDDDEDDQFFLRNTLAEIGCGEDFEFLSSGSELFQYLNRNKHSLPSLILLDAHLAAMTRMETYDQLKSSADFSEISVVFLSGSKEHWDLIRQQNPRLDGAKCVIKAMNEDEVREALRTFQEHIR